MKKQDLTTFDLFRYLKDNHDGPTNPSFFLANEETYRVADIQFPLRNSFYGIGITYSGNSGQVTIGSTTYPVQIGSLITIGPGTVSKWATDYSSRHTTVFFTEKLLDQVVNTAWLKTRPFFGPTGQHVVILDEAHLRRMKTLFNALTEFQQVDSVVPGLVHSILLFTSHCHTLLADRSAGQPAELDRITHAFNALLIKHFLAHREVNFYADNLHITAKHLSEVLVKTTGKSAKEHILALLLMEAKSLLRQTTMSVIEISLWLGYADASHFIKLFKRREGLTPAAYKKRGR